MRKAKKQIIVEQPIGVASVFDDTLALSQIASREPKGKILDMGTGTGYVAIYLSKLGFSADGADINPNAISIAKKNARKNGVNCNFFISDLFSNIKNKYDIIVFNPPLGNEKGSKFSEIIKSLIRKSRVFMRIRKDFSPMQINS